MSGPEDVFEATYAVPMHCQGCADDIETKIGKLEGLCSVKFDLAEQIMCVKGSVPPSKIIDTVQNECNREIVIRGAGGSNGSAVCILETDDAKHKIQGLVRVVELGSGGKTLLDVTVDGLSKPGPFTMNLHESGDLSQGLTSCGASIRKFQDFVTTTTRGTIHSGNSVFTVDQMPVWKMIGRSISMVNRSDPTYALVGVVARSAGVWENTKQVCACSGKTVWEERKDALENNLVH